MFMFHGHHGAVTHRVHPGARAAGLALCTLLLVAGCAGPGSTSAAPSSSLPPATSSAPTTTVPPTTTTTTEQPGWTPVSTINGAIAVDERSVVTPGGADVQLIRFRAGRARFDLHVGSMDPPTGGAVLPADAGSALSSAEVGSLLGAFNGGFQISTGAGGFEVDGHVLVPLVAGRASFVIDASGAAHVGVWGSGLPAPGEQVVSVRQNLVPLVLGSAPAPDVGSVAAWGATLGGVPNVARSAVGEDAAGNIVYAGSMAALPSDMAAALLDAGVTTGMELDINPEWVQAVVTPAPGGTPAAAVPGQNRPADQYVVGWTRDFIAAVAP